jgi:hypothetical protein
LPRYLNEWDFKWNTRKLKDGEYTAPIASMRGIAPWKIGGTVTDLLGDSDLVPRQVTDRAKRSRRRWPVIGFLDERLLEAMGVRLRAFHGGLKETGFVDGDNVSIVYRFAENQTDRLAGLAADLVQRNTTVIATAGPSAAPVSASCLAFSFLRHLGRLSFLILWEVGRPAQPNHKHD